MSSIRSRSSLLLISCSVILFFFLSDCMSVRSDLDGKFSAPQKVKSDRAPVSVFFHFTHLEQEKGFDVVPKIVQPRRGFRDIFGESMKQLSNIRTFATYTDSDNDIDNVERRRVRDSLKASNDITLHITVRKENSFTKHVLAEIVTWGLLALVPVGYSWEYIVTVDVCSPSGTVIASYHRRSALTTWTHQVFIFIYPFLPSEGKIEEIYLESLQNIFAQIEADGVLK